MNTDYNTQRLKLVLPEYGRNVHNMVKFALTVKDQDERNKVVQAIIKVIGQLNPHLRDVEEFKHKLWDHLFIMSDYKLDVDSPYPKPKPVSEDDKPDRLAYPTGKIRFKHYGKTIEQMIDKCRAEKDKAKREEFTHVIANFMKKCYLTWNTESVGDNVILADLKQLSKGELQVGENFILASTNDLLPAVKKRKQEQKPVQKVRPFGKNNKPRRKF